MGRFGLVSQRLRFDFVSVASVPRCNWWSWLWL